MNNNLVIDARKEACPKPVIRTKKKLDEISEGIVTTIVDNEIAKENLSKLAKSMGFEFSWEERDGDYYTSIVKGQVSQVEEKAEEKLEDLTVALTSDKMGAGADKLGQVLMKSFIYTLSETTPYPKTIVLYNTAVRLSCRGSEVLDDLKKLEENGVEIISCGTCLDFLELKDDLALGSVSNMYTIYEKISRAEKNISIG